MAVSPHSFYDSIGAFDSYNPHYLRDVASFSAALGPAWPWRSRDLPGGCRCFAVSTLQYGLHSVNHLVDIDIAHPAWTGYLRLLLALRGDAGAGVAAAHGDRARAERPLGGHNQKENPHDPHRTRRPPATAPSARAP